jgi:hypothetical protein
MGVHFPFPVEQSSTGPIPASAGRISTAKQNENQARPFSVCVPRIFFFFSLMKEKEGSIGSTSLQQLRNEVAAPQLQETSVSSPPSCKFLHEVHVASIQATFDEPTTRTAKCHFKICRPRERRVRHGRGTNGENGNGRRQRPFPSFLC